MNEILITGASGQLGIELTKLFDENDIKYNAPNSDILDITNIQEVETYFEKSKPKYIFHCAAYTAVDAAEDIEKELNWAVNANGTENIAKIAGRFEAVLIYISTDYVFNGEGTEEYTVDAEVDPQNEYGVAKLAGEKAVEKYCPSYYIVRTSWVFGEYGENFVYTMKKLATTHKTLRVVADQYGRPTWTRTLAEFLLYIYNENPDFGIYHLSNENSCSWYEFATEILKDTKVKVEPVISEEYPQKAYRPRHSIMNLSKAKAIGFEIPTWQKALEIFLEKQ